MKIKQIITIISTVCLGLTSSVSAQKWITVKNSDTVSLDSVKQVFIHSIKGVNLSVTGDNSNSLSYEVFIQANEAAMLSNFGGGRLYSKKDGDMLELFFQSTDSDEYSLNSNKTWIKELFTGNKGSKNNRETKEARLTITLPKELLVRIDGKYSNIKAENLQSKVEISNRSGSVEAKKLGNGIEITNNYGSHQLQDISGKVIINSRSGNTDIELVKGDVEVYSNYTEMTVKHIEGSVIVANKSGNLVAENISGTLNFRGDYSKLTVKNVKGMVSIDNKSGSVDAEFIGGFKLDGYYTNMDIRDITSTIPVEIYSKSGKIILKRARGSVNITGDYMTIETNEIGGDFKFTGKSSSVESVSISGNVFCSGEYGKYTFKQLAGERFEIDNRSGSVATEFVSPKTKWISVRNSYGSVSLKLNPEFIGSGRLKADNGTITFPFSKELIKREIDKNELREIELSGKGGLELSVTTQNGSIVIE
jgi:hypothetical protein